MADIFKSGFIGMGSRVFIGKQADYKTTATAVRQYACPIQPGSRPAKQIESLQVDQLFPTFLAFSESAHQNQWEKAQGALKIRHLQYWPPYIVEVPET